MNWRLDKTLCWLICMGALATPLLAAPPGQPILGFRTGMSFEGSSSSAFSTSVLPGMIGGVTCEYGLTPSLSLQSELTFVQRGTELVTSSGAKLTERDSALELPLYLKAGYGEKFRPYLFGGPVFVLNVSHHTEANGPLTGESFALNPRLVDLALSGGIGADIHDCFVDLRYATSLLEGDARSRGWQTHGFQLSLGLHLDI